MIFGEATTTVTATASEVLDFVCDLDRYRQADTKIRKVVGVEHDGDDRIVRFRSRLRGVPTPPVRQRVRRTSNERVDITDVVSWQNRLVTFRGSVTCTREGSDTLVTHREEFHFHGRLRPLVERFLKRWLADDIAGEVARMSQLLSIEAELPQPRPSTAATQHL